MHDGENRHSGVHEKQKENVSKETNTREQDSYEGKMDGPHLSDPTEASNRSQDEGKVYDL